MNNIKVLKWIIAGLLFLNVLLIVSTLLGSKHRRIEPRQLIINKLDFDNNQVVKYDQLIQGHQKLIRNLDKKIHDKKSTLLSLLKNDSTSNKEDIIISEIASLHKKIEQTHMAHFREIKKLCNPDQALKLNTMDLNKVFFKRKRKPKHPKDK